MPREQSRGIGLETCGYEEISVVVCQSPIHYLHTIALTVTNHLLE